MLGLDGRGTIASAVLIPTIVAYGGELGLPAATGYLIGERKADAGVVVGTARSLALGFCPVLLVISVGLTLLLPIADAERGLALAFAAFVPLSLMQRVHLAILQGGLRMRAFNAVRVVGGLAYVLALAVLPLLGAATTGGVIAALLVGNAVPAALAIGVGPRHRPLLAWDRAIAQRLLSYGARGHLGTLSPIDSLRLDQLVLALFLPAQVLGLYVTAMTFVTANRVLGVSLGMVAFPVAARTPAERARAPLLQLVGATLVLATIAAVLEIAFGRPLLGFVFGREFLGAYAALVVLAPASIAMNVRGVLADWLRGAGRPGIATVGEVISLAVLIPTFALLWNGHVTGVSIAVLAASAVSLGAIVVLARGRAW